MRRTFGHASARLSSGGRYSFSLSHERAESRGRVSHLGRMADTDVRGGSHDARTLRPVSRPLEPDAGWRTDRHDHSSRLLPVRRDGMPAMLKIATEPEERRGAETMVWWAGEGAARVLAHDGDALLMERATGERSLAEMARSGRDDEAMRILCAAAARLHAPRCPAAPIRRSFPWTEWFAELEPAAARYGGILEQAAAMARDLLAEPARDRRSCTATSTTATSSTSGRTAGWPSTRRDCSGSARLIS